MNKENILDMIEERNLGQRFQDMKPFSVGFEEAMIDEGLPHATIHFANRYQLYLVASCTYIANEVQRPDFSKSAKEGLVRYIYKDFEHLIDCVCQCAMNQDIEGILKYTNNMRNLVRGKVNE